MIPAVLLEPLARIGAEALPVRLRETLRDWDLLNDEQQQVARDEVEGMAGAVCAGRC